jgi:hypothetical protein
MIGWCVGADLGGGCDSSRKTIIDQVQALWIGGVEENVPRLQVAVDESILVHVLES